MRERRWSLVAAVSPALHARRLQALEPNLQVALDCTFPPGGPSHHASVSSRLAPRHPASPRHSSSRARCASPLCRAARR
eukprot:4384067-Pleurochrysis_carterae.AAC.1